MATLTEMLVEHLDRDEGKGPFRGGRYYPYTDTVGKVTIGTGRNLTDKGVSEDERLLMLHNDIRDSLTEAMKYPWFAGLDPARAAVIIMMIFNLGPDRFSLFKNTQNKVASGDWEGASVNMAASLWHKQVGHRAEVYERIMRTGEWE